MGTGALYATPPDTGHASGCVDDGGPWGTPHHACVPAAGGAACQTGDGAGPSGEGPGGRVAPLVAWGGVL